jgi:hypothetical protein
MGVCVATVRYERRIAASSDLVWSIIERPESIVEWFPGVVDAVVEGSKRTITLRTGAELPEEILTIDPLIRRFQYRISSPMYRFHLGTIDVIALSDDECLCIYSTTAVPDVMALVVGGGTYAALGEIERIAQQLRGVVV